MTHFEDAQRGCKKKADIEKHKDDEKRGCIYRGRTKLVHT